MKTRYIAKLTIIAITISCGVQDTKTPDVLTESQGTTTTEEVSNDNTVASEDISTQTESGLNSIVNLDISSSAGLTFNKLLTTSALSNLLVYIGKTLA